MPAPSTTIDPPTTVIVNLPPEIVERLNPVETFPSPAWATIIAAGIAVAAALVAFGGVILQIRANAREQARGRAAEHARARRADQSRIVAQAARDASDMWDFFAAHSAGKSTAEDKFAEMFDRATLSVELLRLEGLPKSAEMLSELSGEILDALRGNGDVGVTVMEAVIEVFREELNRHDTAVSN